MSPTITLERLLLVLFGDVELRSLVAGHLHGGEAILDHLPAPPATPAATVKTLVAELVRRGLVDDAFFAALRDLRPLRVQAIDAAQAVWPQPRAHEGPGTRRWRRAAVLVAVLAAAGIVAAAWPEPPSAPEATAPVAPRPEGDPRVFEVLDRLAAPPAAPVDTPVREGAPSKPPPILPTYAAAATPATKRTLAQASTLELVAFSMSASKSILAEDAPQEWGWGEGECRREVGKADAAKICADPLRPYRHFSPDEMYTRPVSEQVALHPFPIFTVVLRNRGTTPAVVTQIRYRVYATSSAKFGISGPLTPTARYIHDIRHAPGDQLARLEAPFVIEPGAIGDFELELRPRDVCVGCGWLMQIFFAVDTGGVGVATEPFQLWMSRSSP